MAARFERVTGGGPRSSPLSGLLGCVAAVVLLPFVLLGSLAALVATALSIRRARRRIRERARQMGVVREPVRSDREIALCSFVQAMALDATFTRQEAATVPVISEGGAEATELLAEAIGRGWVAEREGDALAVTDEGRREAERYLRFVGL